jgi:choline-sulfatase
MLVPLANAVNSQRAVDGLPHVPDGRLPYRIMPDSPNILFICADQHSFRYTGYAGHSMVQTPNLDSIARRGVTMTNAYCGSPVCVPGRASMMTGLYAHETNSFCNSTVWDGSQPTWGTRLHNAGYDCYATGKLDLNEDFDLGFKETDTKNGHHTNPDITSLFRNPLIYRADERSQVDGSPRAARHHDADLAGTAVDFIDNTSATLDRPWAYYVGFSLPHPRFSALEKYWDLYPPEQVDLPSVTDEDLENLHDVYKGLRYFKQLTVPVAEERVRRARAAYYGMITELDEYVGWLLDALDRTGQLENTLVVYTSDHGETLGAHGLWSKNNMYEDSVHVPMLMAGAALPPGVAIDTPVGHVDMVATLLEMAGAERPSGLRGNSLLPLVSGDGGDHPGFAYSECHCSGNLTGTFMVRRGDWKYVHFTWYDGLLFNLADDPDELVNRFDDPGASDVLKELKRILNHQVDTEEVTRRAFDTQARKLNDIVTGKTEGELARVLEGRLGPGQARAVAARVISQTA